MSQLTIFHPCLYVKYSISLHVPMICHRKSSYLIAYTVFAVMRFYVPSIVKVIGRWNLGLKSERLEKPGIVKHDHLLTMFKRRVV